MTALGGCLVASVLLVAAEVAAAQPGATGLDLLRQQAQGSLIAMLEAERWHARAKSFPVELDVSLDMAAALAPTRPDLARAHLRRVGSPATLAPAMVEEIAQAIAFYADRPLPPLALDDPSLVALFPTAADYDPRVVRRYARRYAAAQRKYNGSLPSLTLLQGELKTKVFGRVPFWDVDPQSIAVTAMGAIEHSPFTRPDGRIRIFNHYLDEAREAALEQVIGRPADGTIKAEMTSSRRTLLLYPADGLPFMLKFSGDGWDQEEKRLTPRQVQASVERSLHLRHDAQLVPEPAGLVVEQPEVTAIYRPLPLPPPGQLEADDVLLPAHVLLSSEFARRSPLGRALIGARSTNRWCVRNLGQDLEQRIRASLEKNFTHHELHTQNIDALIGRGRVKCIFIKDVLDVAHDPALAAASGQAPLLLPCFREPWRYIGEPLGGDDAGWWPLTSLYSFFLNHWKENAEGRLKETSWMSRATAKALNAHYQRALAGIGRGHPELGALAAARFDIEGTITNVRQLLIKTGIKKHFVADEAARPLLNAPGLVISSGFRHGVYDVFSKTAVGFVSGVPTAVHWAPNGTVREYLFRFPAAKRPYLERRASSR